MEAYISEYRTKYLPWRGRRYAQKGWEFVLGSKKDTIQLVQDGAIQLPWEAQPDKGTVKAIKALRLVPNQKQLKNCTVPLFVRELVNLEFLAMPLPFVVALEQNSIPDSLHSLMLINGKGCYEALNGKAFCWPKIVLPHVNALQFFDFGGSKEIDSLFGLSEKTLPSLQFLECGIGKIKRKLDTIAELKGLTFVALEHVNHYDIVDSFNSPLHALSIVDADNKFPFPSIAKRESVELLWLNNLRCEVDCEVFTSFPLLKEINILNSLHIVNVEALLSCKRLESIQFTKCGRPFTKEVKELFVAKHYKRLNIEFA